jgi:hypothetical protein
MALHAFTYNLPRSVFPQTKPKWRGYFVGISSRGQLRGLHFFIRKGAVLLAN